jgi:hypothetical protein
MITNPLLIEIDDVLSHRETLVQCRRIEESLYKPDNSRFGFKSKSIKKRGFSYL